MNPTYELETKQESSLQAQLIAKGNTELEECLCDLAGFIKSLRSVSVVEETSICKLSAEKYHRFIFCIQFSNNLFIDKKKHFTAA